MLVVPLLCDPGRCVQHHTEQVDITIGEVGRQHTDRDMARVSASFRTVLCASQLNLMLDDMDCCMHPQEQAAQSI